MKIFFSILLFLGISFNAFAGNCKFKIEKKNIKIHFYGYKLMSKVPVKGFFKKIELSSAPESFVELKQGLLQSKISISTFSLETNNKERNLNIIQGLFENMIGGKTIKAHVSHFIGNDQKGAIVVKIKMNGKTVNVPMSFQIVKGVLEAKGTINLISEFKANNAFQAFSKICSTYHQGKTWSDVEINFSIPVKKSCT